MCSKKADNYYRRGNSVIVAGFFIAKIENKVTDRKATTFMSK